MALEQHVTTNDDFYVACDHSFPCHILNEAEDTAIDIAGWSLSWKLYRKGSSTVLTKTTPTGIVISGVFNASPVLNTQRARVLVLKADVLTYTPGMYQFELKRTDTGFNTVLIFGTTELKKALHA